MNGDNVLVEITRQWNRYRETMMPTCIDANEQEHVHNAFYCGAGAMLKMAIEAMRGLPETEALALFEHFYSDMRELSKRFPMPPGSR